jgi:hypothetical protein
MFPDIDEDNIENTARHLHKNEINMRLTEYEVKMDKKIKQMKTKYIDVFNLLEEKGKGYDEYMEKVNKDADEFDSATSDYPNICFKVMTHMNDERFKIVMDTIKAKFNETLEKGRCLLKKKHTRIFNVVNDKNDNKKITEDNITGTASTKSNSIVNN